MSPAATPSPAADGTALPPRPGPVEERASQGLFLALAPRLRGQTVPPVPEELAPSEEVEIPRRDGRGTLKGTWYPLPERPVPRGAVLLLHPWVPWGRAHFHRRGRLQALREAGYEALAIDLPGCGRTRKARGYFDRVVEDGLVYLEGRRTAEHRGRELPLHLWGLSSGGYWGHLLLSRRAAEGRPLTGAVFEDVSPHLLEWSWRMAPQGRPFYRLFRKLFPAGHRFLDLRNHAPHLGVRRVAYVSGKRDLGVLPHDTEALAQGARAGGIPTETLIVPEAQHLGAIKRAQEEVLALTLETFRRAEEGGCSRSEHRRPGITEPAGAETSS